MLDPDNNYCFGEGGAGTFSDGKLYTRATGRGPIQDLMELLVACGAPPSILYEARPHIGTNRLPGVVQVCGSGWWRRAWTSGSARADERLAARRRPVVGVRLADGATLPARAVILATGHSARDVYHLLDAHGVALAAKPSPSASASSTPRPTSMPSSTAPWRATRPWRGALHAQAHGRGGGGLQLLHVPGRLHRRGGHRPGRGGGQRHEPVAPRLALRQLGAGRDGRARDLREGALAGLAWQAAVERAAFVAGGGRFRAPAQRVTDYLAGRVSTDPPDCSYRPGLQPHDLRTLA
ncbi:MAG: hypothetical protein R3F43_22270 [bacterium]